MEIKIIKGTHQIGGCVTAIKTSNTKIVVDFGEDLNDEDKTYFDREKIMHEIEGADAVFITHSHLDHAGLINLVPSNIPIYIEEKAKIILEIGSDFGVNASLPENIITFELTKNRKLTPITVKDINVTPYIVDHSSFNSCMYLIEAEGKRVLHTGDYRNHGRKGKIFSSILDKIGHVDCLITEGTTLTRPNQTKYKTEEELEQEAKELFAKYDQVFVLSSSTNLDRLVTFYKARGNKKVVIDTFTSAITKAIDFPVSTKNRDVFQWNPSKYNKIKDKAFKEKYMSNNLDYGFLPNYVMFIKQSMLPDLKKLKKEGMITNACLIYSMWKGYIDKEEKLSKMLDEVHKLGIDLYELHTSGHADSDAMKVMNTKLRPQKTIIIHTESNQKTVSVFDNVQNIVDGEIIYI